MRTSHEFVVQKRKFQDLRDAVKAMDSQKPCLVVQGPTGCGKKTSISKALEELGLVEDVVQDTGVSRLCSYLCQLVFSLSLPSPRPVVPVIYFAESVVPPEELAALRAWLNTRPSLGSVRGFIFVIDESRDAESVLEILSPVSNLIKFRPLTLPSVKKLIKAEAPHLEAATVDDIALTSGGDARFALHALAGARAGALGKRRRTPASQTPKDEEITFFHAVARTLHAKPETFRPGNLLNLPCVSDRFDFFNSFVLENCPDFSPDISKLADFLEISSLANTLSGEEARAGLLLFGWRGGAAPGGFRELRRPRVVEEEQRRTRNRRILKTLVKYCGDAGNCYERFWFIHKMLEISRGLFPQFPGFVASAIHALACHREVGQIPEKFPEKFHDKFPDTFPDEIEEC